MMDASDLIREARERLNMPATARSGASYKCVRVRGVRVSYFEVGPSDAPTVLCLHGVGSSGLEWLEVAKRLQANARVVVPDLPGWGLSALDECAPTLEFHLEVLKGFCEHLGLRKITVVGQSYGGLVALLFACAAGADKVVLLNPLPPSPRQHMVSPISRYGLHLFRSRRLGKAVLALLNKRHVEFFCDRVLVNKSLLCSEHREVIFQMLRQPLIADSLHMLARIVYGVDWAELENKVSKIDCPILVLRGAKDHIFGPTSTEHIGRLLPKARIIEIENAAHMLSFDAADEIVSYLPELS